MKGRKDLLHHYSNHDLREEDSHHNQIHIFQIPSKTENERADKLGSYLYKIRKIAIV